MTQDWFYKLLGEETGPVTFSAMRELVRDGHLAPQDEVRTSTTRWMRADQIPELSHPGAIEEPELATDMDLDRLMAQISTEPMLVSVKRQAQRAAVAAATTPEAEWYYKLLGQEMGPTSHAEILQQIQAGTLQGSDPIRLGRKGPWQPLEQAPQFAESVARTQPQPEWYCRVLGQELGPMTFDELQHMAQSGSLHKDDAVRHGAAEPWTPADRTRGLLFPRKSKAFSVTHDRTSTLVPFGDAAKKREWYYEILGQQMGPISFREMSRAVGNGTLTLEDRARRGKKGGWTLVRDVPGLVSTEEKAAHLAMKSEGVRPQLAAPQLVIAPVSPAAPVIPAAVPKAVEPPPVAVALAPKEAAPPSPALPPVPPRPIPAPTASAPMSGTAGSGASVPGSMASASRTPAPPPSPAYKPAQRSSGPTWDIGAMLGGLKGQMNGKAVAAIAVILLIGVYFGASHFGIHLFGQPGATEYAKLNVIWQEAKTIHDGGDNAEQWNAYGIKHLSELETLSKRIQNQNPSSETVLLQSMLFCARDHLPRLMKPEVEGKREASYQIMELEMANAAKLVNN